MVSNTTPFFRVVQIIYFHDCRCIGVLYKSKFLVKRKSLKYIYYAFIHSHLNYANISWASANPNKLKTIHNKQKHTARIILNEDRITQARPLMTQLNILNVYLLNFYQIRIFLTHNGEYWFANSLLWGKDYLLKNDINVWRAELGFTGEIIQYHRTPFSWRSKNLKFLMLITCVRVKIQLNL